MLYQEYFKQPPIPESEMEEDVRSWLTKVYFSFSADAGLPPSAPEDDTGDLETRLSNLRNSGLCMQPGARFGDKLIAPEVLPDWLPQEDLDVYVAEFERTGFTGALNNYYRSLDLNWEVLGPWSGKPIEVPALFVTSDRDAPMLWSGEAMQRMEQSVPQLRDTIIYDNCGHWIQQERSDDFNHDLLAFLSDVRPV
jgi:pimeloyl-ACP methyl ester carboxylesterase